MPSCAACLLLLLAAKAAAVEAARVADGSLHLSAPETVGCSPFVDVTLYGEALCPFTAAFVTDTLAPLLPPGGRPYETFNNVIKFRYVAWGNARNTSSQGPEQCQHGPAECRLNRIINCAQKLHPAQSDWLPFVVCLESTDLKEMEGAVTRCAKESNLDPISLKSCGTGVLGTQLERAAASETAALKPEHTYVPWVVVNTIPLGELDAKLKEIVCVAFPGRRPAACWDPPAGANSARLGGRTLAPE